MLPSSEREKAIRKLGPAEALDLLYTWRGFWARDNQVAPDKHPLTGIAWDVWMILAGRAWGKTRTGASWIQEQIYPPGGGPGARRVCLVARTAADVRDVMVEGESGLLATAHPARRPVWKSSSRRLQWPNGAIGTTFSADEPDQLRGPQYEKAWCDEFASWRYGQETWDNLQMILRLGAHPQAVITTTPRPTPLVKRVLRAEGTLVTRGSTFENKALPLSFIERLRREFEGSRLARQELYAEVLDDNPGALWKRSRIDDLRVGKATVPPLKRVVVAVDPSVTSNEDSAETGIIVVGLGIDGHAYVLDDASLVATPAKWGAAVVRAYEGWKADRVIGEVNNGGDLVESNVRTAATALGVTNISYKAVRASRGKALRAEPVAALYEQGRVHHVGSLAKLEDQLCEWDPTGLHPSPDRLDALVWALTELMLGRQASRFRAASVSSREEE